jgi:ribose/xylose/arabinose/galactoside ABC-type transport system permease subunit
MTNTNLESPDLLEDAFAEGTDLRSRLRFGLGAQAGRNVGLLALLGALLLSLALTHPIFFSGANIETLASNGVMLGLASIGMAALMIAGNIDLSVGSMFALVACLSAILSLHVNAYLAFFLTIPIGAGFGLINGALVWRIKISPLIITLAGLSLYLGIAELVTTGDYVPNLPQAYANIGQSKLLGIDTPVWILVFLAIAAHLILSRTTIGRQIYAVGGNIKAAGISGVRTRRVVIGLFVANGAIIGLSGALEASRFDSASTQFGANLALDAVTAVILGGVAFSGGEGSLFGVGLAVILLTIISDALIIYQINPFFSDVTEGALLLVAVIIDQLTQEQRERLRTIQALRAMRARRQQVRDADGDGAGSMEDDPDQVEVGSAALQHERSLVEWRRQREQEALTQHYATYALRAKTSPVSFEQFADIMTHVGHPTAVAANPPEPE